MLHNFVFAPLEETLLLHDAAKTSGLLAGAGPKPDFW
jgi:hypothetical protein